MTKIKYSFYIMAALLLMFQSKTDAQVTLQLLTDQEYNSNPFRSRIPESNFISSYDFTLQYEFGKAGIMYNGTAFSFNNTQDRNFYYHMGGVWYNFDSSSVSLSAEQRINNPIYSYFNYSELALNYEHKFSFWGITANIYPSLTYTSYTSISILNNVKSTLLFSLNKSFETKTTFIVGGGVNHKIYTQPSASDLFLTVNDSNQTVETLVQSQNATTLTQLTGYGRVAQSITPTTGLALQLTGKKIVSGIASSVKDLSLTYGDEAEIFDDPVNYEGTSLAVELTQILFEDLQLRLGYYYNLKNYPSQGIYDHTNTYFSDVERADTQNILGFSAKKTFSAGEYLSIDLGFRFYYIKNSSNSFLYKYNSSAFSFNVGFTF